MRKVLISCRPFLIRRRIHHKFKGSTRHNFTVGNPCPRKNLPIQGTLDVAVIRSLISGDNREGLAWVPLLGQTDSQF